ncbi:MAG: 16S rRNA (cytosine(1402)-N(4))-methyltransferase RsmH [Alphaproteobacteria bacterium]
MAVAAHKPVLLRETVEALAPRASELFVDGTFGAGGISRAILEAADCSVIAIDRDPDAVARGARLAQEFSGRFEILQGRFGSMEVLLKPALARKGKTAVDGVTLDLGVSSYQLDEAERGFSFLRDGPLDMRMGGDGPSAADIVNEAPASDLEWIIRHYGEERDAKRIVRAITERRARVPFVRTRDLAELIENTVRKPPQERIHPATRTFQALRIAVNEELRELAQGLAAAERLLKEAGRLAVVSFHSLEDRIVKVFLADRAKARPAGSRHLPAANDAGAPMSFRLLNRHPIAPTDEETSLNPRARSAKLRAAVRTGEPSQPLDLSRFGVMEIRP